MKIILALALSLSFVPWAWGKDPQDWFLYEPDGQTTTLISLDTMKRLAEQGDTHAQVRLGYIYGSAYHRVPQDQRESVKWYRMAAEQGHWEGMNALAFKYFEGKGVPVDYVLSYMWFNLTAAVAPTSHAKNFRAWRDVVAKFMTPQQIAEAQRLAGEWMEKHKK